MQPGLKKRRPSVLMTGGLFFPCHSSAPRSGVHLSGRPKLATDRPELIRTAMPSPWVTPACLVTQFTQCISRALLSGTRPGHCCPSLPEQETASTARTQSALTTPGWMRLSMDVASVGNLQRRNPIKQLRCRLCSRGHFEPQLIGRGLPRL